MTICECTDRKKCKNCVQRDYRQRYPERVAQSHRRYYERHGDAVRAKQREYTRTRSPEENARRVLVDRGTPKKFLTGLAAAAKQRSAQKSIEYAINRDYLLELYERQDGACALTGQLMTTIVGKGRVRTNISVDRIDPTAGYVQGNIQLVCDYINTLKQNLTVDELRDTCKLILATLEP